MLSRLSSLLTLGGLAFFVAASPVHAGPKSPAKKSLAAAEGVRLGLLAHVNAKATKEADLEKFLIGGLAFAKDEPATIQWFALKFGPKQFGIFDTFVDEAGRKAHMDGKIPAALGQKAAEIVEGSPDIKPIEILAVKVASNAAKAHVKLALLATLEAKPGKEKDVQAFLESALPLVKKEPKTIHWYAWRLSPTTFGIFDTFADEAGRQAHLDGKIAAALGAKATELFAKPPQIEKLDLLAVKP